MHRFGPAALRRECLHRYGARQEIPKSPTARHPGDKPSQSRNQFGKGSDQSGNGRHGVSDSQKPLPVDPPARLRRWLVWNELPATRRTAGRRRGKSRCEIGQSTHTAQFHLLTRGQCTRPNPCQEPFPCDLGILSLIFGGCFISPFRSATGRKYRAVNFISTARGLLRHRARPDPDTGAPHPVGAAGIPGR